MRNLVALLFIVTLAACDNDSGISGPGPGGETGSCSNDGQKQFVLDNLYAWYLWNDLLPDNISIADYASPEELVTSVTQEYVPRDANGDPVGSHK